MGPRLSTTVAFGAASTGGMSFSPEAIVEDRSAADALVRVVLDASGSVEWPEPLTVAGTPVGDDGAFTVPPDAGLVNVASGAVSTTVTVPGEPPLPERRLG